MRGHISVVADNLNVTMVRPRRRLQEVNSEGHPIRGFGQTVARTGRQVTIRTLDDPISLRWPHCQPRQHNAYRFALA
jgi:hypothetical protein